MTWGMLRVCWEAWEFFLIMSEVYIEYFYIFRNFPPVTDYFSGCFRFTAKLSRQYRDFPQVIFKMIITKVPLILST